LGGEFWNSEGTVLLGTTGGEWSKAADEEVETWEWNKVDSKLTKIGVELTWETKGAGSSGHNHGNEVVKITIGWGGELEGTEADIVKGFVINAENFIGGFDKLVDGEGAVVWFDDGIRNLWRWDDGVGGEDTIWVFFTELVEKKGTKTRASTTTKGVNKLESLKGIAGFGFFTDDIEDGFAEFLTFSVVSFGPVVTSTRLTENEVIWTEELTILTSTDGIHGTWFKIDKDSTWNVFATSGFVVVNVNTF
jgi:hypothetical protein